MLNDRPVYLKGFGKHEDLSILGRGFHWGIVKRDFECLKWTQCKLFSDKSLSLCRRMVSIRR
ncbi:MAG: glycoside hydrolase family 2 TIM barrel-domain containing protein [Mediterraneibacter gnavus]